MFMEQGRIRGFNEGLLTMEAKILLVSYFVHAFLDYVLSNFFGLKKLIAVPCDW